MHLSELKQKPITELLEIAATNGIENASRLRKQELIFAILKKRRPSSGESIFGDGVLEVLPDGFGFLRSPDAIYLPAPTTSTSRPRRSAASTCAPATRSKARSARPKEGERYFALLKVDTINFEPPEKPSTRSCSRT